MLDRDSWRAARLAGRPPRTRSTVVVDSFFHRLCTEGKQTRFPATEIEQQLGAGTTTPS